LVANTDAGAQNGKDKGVDDSCNDSSGTHAWHFARTSAAWQGFLRLVTL
jgi:hypothetical protein